jgi:hypothetical protein
MRGPHLLTLLALALSVAAAPRPAGAEPPVPAADRPAPAAPAPPARSGLAVGVELGDPTSATAGWFSGALSVSGALGTGTLAGPGFAAHADVQYVVHRLAPALPVRVGLGGRFYHHGYDAMSADEVPDSHYGVRASASVALERGALQLYAEVAPGVDVVRTRSCTFASGADTICPHAQASPLFVQVAVGARWFLSH